MCLFIWWGICGQRCFHTVALGSQPQRPSRDHRRLRGVAPTGKSQWEEHQTPWPNAYVKIPSFQFKMVIEKRLPFFLQTIKEKARYVFIKQYIKKSGKLPPTRTLTGKSVWSKNRPLIVSMVPPWVLPSEGEIMVTSRDRRGNIK